MGTYLAATEFVSAKKSKGEVLVFRKGSRRNLFRRVANNFKLASAIKTDCSITEKPLVKRDTFDVDAANMLQRQTAIFHWQDVCYDIKIKKETRRILDHVDGWVKPGTLTALMVSLLLIELYIYDIHTNEVHFF